MRRKLLAGVVLALAACVVTDVAAQHQIVRWRPPAAAPPVGGDTWNELFTADEYDNTPCGSPQCINEESGGPNCTLDGNDNTHSDGDFDGNIMEVNSIPNYEDCNIKMLGDATLDEAYMSGTVNIDDIDATALWFSFTSDGGNLHNSGPVGMKCVDSSGSLSCSLYTGSGGSWRDAMAGEAYDTTFNIEIYFCDKGSGCLENGGSDGWCWWVDGVEEGCGANAPGESATDAGFGWENNGQAAGYLDNWVIDTTACQTCS